MKLAQFGRLLRTVRHYRFVQLAAQARHLMLEEGRPGIPRGEAPALAVQTSRTPFLPAPAHAHFDGDRAFELIHCAHRFEREIDWDYTGAGPLWVFHLNQFDWARDPGLPPDVRWRTIDHWIRHCERGAGWAPHPISLRILSWGKLLLTPGALAPDPAESARMRASLAQQAQTLGERLEVRLQANHLFSNLLGVVFAGLLFEGDRANAWLEREADLRHELEVQVLADGSHIERSPMYHALLVENVLDLLNLARVSRARAPSQLVAALEAAAARMLGAQRVWTHPDGEIALFGDSAFDVAHPPRILEDYASALGVEARGPARPGMLDDAGVFRLEAGDATLIVTAGAPAPPYQPGHAHCDALSFELSLGRDRVVSDSGVAEYIPGPMRDASRATASHATLQIDGEEQSEVWSAHRIGGRARVEVQRAEAGCVEASCVTWSRRRTRHRRMFRVRGDGFEIEDRIEGDSVPLRFVLPLDPSLSRSMLDAEAATLELELRGGARLRVELPNGVRWHLEQADCFPRFGERVERSVLVGKADGFREGTWRFAPLPA